MIEMEEPADARPSVVIRWASGEEFSFLAPPMTLTLNGVRVTWEAIKLLVNPDPTVWLRFIREGDQVLVETTRELPDGD